MVCDRGMSWSFIRILQPEIEAFLVVDTVLIGRTLGPGSLA